MKTYEAFATLLHSWGSDTPPEAIWAGNEFLRIFEKTYPVLIGLELVEDDQTGHNNTILDIIKANLP